MAPPERRNKKLTRRDKKPQRSTENKKSDLVSNIKYKNTLPDIPFDLKFLKIPFSPTRFIQYNLTSLERSYKSEIHVDRDLGLNIDLTNQEKYAIGYDGQMDSADEKLLEEEETETVQDSKRSRHTTKNVPWLRRTEYISTEKTRFQPETIERAEAKVGFSIKNNLKEDILYTDREVAMNAIEKTFEDNKKPIEKHHSKPNVYAVETLNIFPDFKNWKYPCAQVIFDSDPAPKIRPGPAKIEKMSQAMVRGVVDQNGEQYVAYFLPSEETTVKRRKDAAKNRLYDDNHEYDYKIAGEFNWEVKSKSRKGYEENYFFNILSDGVYYNELETRVRLRKIRPKIGLQSSSVDTTLAVRYVSTNERNFNVHKLREMQLQPYDEEEEAKAEEAVTRALKVATESATEMITKNEIDSDDDYVDVKKDSDTNNVKKFINHKIIRCAPSKVVPGSDHDTKTCKKVIENEIDSDDDDNDSRKDTKEGAMVIKNEIDSDNDDVDMEQYSNINVKKFSNHKIIRCAPRQVGPENDHDTKKCKKVIENEIDSDDDDNDSRKDTKEGAMVIKNEIDSDNDDVDMEQYSHINVKKFSNHKIIRCAPRQVGPGNDHDTKKCKKVIENEIDTNDDDNDSRKDTKEGAMVIKNEIDSDNDDVDMEQYSNINVKKFSNHKIIRCAPRQVGPGNDHVTKKCEKVIENEIDTNDDDNDSRKDTKEGAMVIKNEIDSDNDDVDMEQYSNINVKKFSNHKIIRCAPRQVGPGNDHVTKKCEKVIENEIDTNDDDNDSRKDTKEGAMVIKNEIDSDNDDVDMEQYSHINVKKFSNHKIIRCAPRQVGPGNDHDTKKCKKVIENEIDTNDDDNDSRKDTKEGAMVIKNEIDSDNDDVDMEQYSHINVKKFSNHKIIRCAPRQVGPGNDHVTKKCEKVIENEIDTNDDDNDSRKDTKEGAMVIKNEIDSDNDDVDMEQYSHINVKKFSNHKIIRCAPRQVGPGNDHDTKKCEKVIENEIDTNDDDNDSRKDTKEGAMVIKNEIDSDNDDVDMEQYSHINVKKFSNHKIIRCAPRQVGPGNDHDTKKCEKVIENEIDTNDDDNDSRKDTKEGAMVIKNEIDSDNDDVDMEQYSNINVKKFSNHKIIRCAPRQVGPGNDHDTKKCKKVIENEIDTNDDDNDSRKDTKEGAMVIKNEIDSDNDDVDMEQYSNINVKKFSNHKIIRCAPRQVGPGNDHVTKKCEKVIENEIYTNDDDNDSRKDTKEGAMVIKNEIDSDNDDVDMEQYSNINVKKFSNHKIIRCAPRQVGPGNDHVTKKCEKVIENEIDTNDDDNDSRKDTKEGAMVIKNEMDSDNDDVDMEQYSNINVKKFSNHKIIRCAPRQVGPGNDHVTKKCEKVIENEIDTNDDDNDSRKDTKEGAMVIKNEIDSDNDDVDMEQYSNINVKKFSNHKIIRCAPRQVGPGNDHVTKKCEKVIENEIDTNDDDNDSRKDTKEGAMVIKNEIDSDNDDVDMEQYSNINVKKFSNHKIIRCAPRQVGPGNDHVTKKCEKVIENEIDTNDDDNDSRKDTKEGAMVIKNEMDSDNDDVDMEQYSNINVKKFSNHKIIRCAPRQVGPGNDHVTKKCEKVIENEIDTNDDDNDSRKDIKEGAMVIKNEIDSDNDDVDMEQYSHINVKKFSNHKIIRCAPRQVGPGNDHDTKKCKKVIENEIDTNDDDNDSRKDTKEGAMVIKNEIDSDNDDVDMEQYSNINVKKFSNHKIIRCAPRQVGPGNDHDTKKCKKVIENEIDTNDDDNDSRKDTKEGAMVIKNEIDSDNDDVDMEQYSHINVKKFSNHKIIRCAPRQVGPGNDRDTKKCKKVIENEIDTNDDDNDSRKDTKEGAMVIKNEIDSDNDDTNEKEDSSAYFKKFFCHNT